MKIQPFVQATEGRLSTTHSVSIEEDFIVDHVREVVFGIGAEKAPGPDGFHCDFFQKMWVVVRHQVSKVFLSVLIGLALVHE